MVAQPERPLPTTASCSRASVSEATRRPTPLAEAINPAQQVVNMLATCPFHKRSSSNNMEAVDITARTQFCQTMAEIHKTLYRWAQLHRSISHLMFHSHLFKRRFVSNRQAVISCNILDRTFRLRVPYFVQPEAESKHLGSGCRSFVFCKTCDHLEPQIAVANMETMKHGGNVNV